jgi:hypothetical protein
VAGIRPSSPPFAAHFREPADEAFVLSYDLWDRSAPPRVVQFTVYQNRFVCPYTKDIITDRCVYTPLPPMAEAGISDEIAERLYELEGF